LWYYSEGVCGEERVMDWIIASGAMSLGILIGILIAWFLLEVKEMNLKALSSSVVIATGGAVLALFQFLSPSHVAREVWLYPVGLLLGFCAASVIDTAYHGYDPDGSRRRGLRNSN
jgi:hypothetical protein